ncbi:hypothetical protein SeLEV6574_g07736 [Synchytrium endobioticum]|uniref:Secreted protein n=1 Tax=Synchytrium endobioticum TaxID=286115 RepID=A0A507CL08_9FUNG|nr:hypothetical protein SeLEV6574_g07736 [Synchytrium endobioticum]
MKRALIMNVITFIVLQMIILFHLASAGGLCGSHEEDAEVPQDSDPGRPPAGGPVLTEAVELPELSPNLESIVGTSPFVDNDGSSSEDSDLVWHPVPGPFRSGVCILLA